MEKKRTRMGNFAGDELKLLLDEVEVRRDILFSKFSSTIDLTRKNKAWAEITERINASSTGCIRTVKKIKKKWADLKQIAKSKEAARRKYTRGTGGGPPPPPLMELEERIIAILPNAIIDGIPGGYDTADSPSIPEATPAVPLQAEGVDFYQPEECGQGDASGACTSVQTGEVTQQLPSVVRGKSKRKRPVDEVEIEDKQIRRELLDIEREKLKTQQEILAFVKLIYQHISRNKDETETNSQILFSPGTLNALTPIINIAEFSDK